MTGSNCPLCHSEGVCHPDPEASSDQRSVSCPTCGEYSVSGLEELEIDKLSTEDRAKLRAIVKEHSLKDLRVSITTQRQVPTLGGSTIAELLSEYPRTASDMMDRAILNLGRLTKHPCDTIGLALSDYPILFGRDLDDMVRMFELLKAMTYVADAVTTTDMLRMTIMPEGWDKIEALKRSSPDSKQVFVAMWFHERTEDFWENRFRPAIEEANDLRALRIDQKEHNDKICDEIVAEIRRSRFVVADFTGNRGGVYYEAGFAQGLGIPVIWTVHKDWLNEVHFDTRQYNHIVYETPRQLRVALQNRIVATIPTGRRGSA